MSKRILADVVHFGVYPTLKEAEQEADRINSDTVRVVILYTGGLPGSQLVGDLVGFAVVPEGYTCWACGHHIDKLGYPTNAE